MIQRKASAGSFLSAPEVTKARNVTAQIFDSGVSQQENAGKDWKKPREAMKAAGAGQEFASAFLS